MTSEELMREMQSASGQNASSRLMAEMQVPQTTTSKLSNAQQRFQNDMAKLNQALENKTTTQVAIPTNTLRQDLNQAAQVNNPIANVPSRERYINYLRNGDSEYATQFRDNTKQKYIGKKQGEDYIKNYDFSDQSSEYLQGLANAYRNTQGGAKQNAYNETIAKGIEDELQKRTDNNGILENIKQGAYTLENSILNGVANVADFAKQSEMAFFDNVSEINADYLLAYKDGKKVQQVTPSGKKVDTEYATSANAMLRNYANRHPENQRLQELYKSIQDKSYNGTAEELQAELKQIQNELYKSWQNTHTSDEHSRMNIQQQLNDYYDGAGKVALDTVAQVGNMVPSIGMGIATGGIGSMATLGANAAGSSFNEAYDNGADFNDAYSYGVLSGATEIGTELIGGDRFVNKALGLNSSLMSKLVKSSGGNWLKNVFVDIAGEATEEGISEALQPLWKHLTNQKTYDLTKNEDLADYFGGIWEAMYSSVPTTLAMGAGANIQEFKNKYDNTKIKNSIVNSIRTNGDLSTDQKVQLINAVNEYAKNLDTFQKQNWSEIQSEINQIEKETNPNDINNYNSAMAEKNEALEPRIIDFQNESQQVTPISIQNQNLTQNNANENVQAKNEQNLIEKDVAASNLKQPKVDSLEKIADMTIDDVKQQPMKYKTHNEVRNTDNGRVREFFNTAKESDIVAQETKNALNESYIKTKHNADVLDKMYEKLNSEGNKAVSDWQLKSIKDFTDEDVAMGAILKQRYEADGDYESAARVLEKIAEAETSAARTLQMASIFDRLSPETMAIFEQRELTKAFEELKKSKTGEWVEANKSKFQLTGEDVQFITEQVNKANECVNEQDKQRELSKIENMINDKLPPEKGAAFKTLRRISMLLNPKTIIRNNEGNALIIPVNMISDLVATQVDKAVAKRTGIRTTNYMNLKTVGKGIIQGAQEAYKDFKTGTRTESNGDRWEMQIGAKPFNEHTNNAVLNSVNKKLNRLNDVTSALMTDKPFSKAAYLNSLEGQMKANNVTEATPEMIEIAKNEAKSRTWNDNNKYTEFVLSFRNSLNKANINGVGLGDIIIPFAKTPANLTKAMVEYSPAGLIEAWWAYNDMNKAISRGEMTAQQQKNFVSLVGKGFAGSLLHAIAGTLAKSGIASGGKDDDKDVANFEQNVLGIQPYSIRIGDKTYSYSWANPINAPLAIMADWNKITDKDSDTLTKAWQLARTTSNVLAENSFLQGVTEFFSKDDLVDGLVATIESIPASMVPTFMSQFASLFDDTKRQSFEYKNDGQTTLNSVKYKIPGLRNELAPTVNTFGEEVSNQNNVFNAFLSPANVREAETTATQDELYALYEATKDKTIFPKQAPYYVSANNEKTNLTSQDRVDFQKAEGQFTSIMLGKIFDSDFYKNSDNEVKSKAVKKVIEDSVLIGKAAVGIETDDFNKLEEKIDTLEKSGLGLADYYIAYIAQKDVKGNKNVKGKTISGTSKKNKINAIINATGLDNKKATVLWDVCN